MKLRRKIAVSVLVFAGLTGAGTVLGASPAAADPGDWWACIAVEDLDMGACVGNPLPDGPLLPLPRL